MVTEPDNGAVEAGAEPPAVLGAVVGAVDGALDAPEPEQAPMAKAAANDRAARRLGVVIVTSI
jgi:hypothetical protein